MRKLKRSEVVEALKTCPIESVLVGASRGTERALTAKQRKFAEAIARGETKAGAYRAAYDTQAKPDTQSQAGTRLMNDSRIAAQVAAFQAAAEAKRYATPAALRSLVIEQLTAMAVDDGVKHAQRLRALELLGKVTEVAAFTERREVVTVSDSGAARDRLIDSLRAALRSDAIDADVVGETLIAELRPGDLHNPPVEGDGAVEGEGVGVGLVNAPADGEGEGRHPSEGGLPPLL